MTTIGFVGLGHMGLPMAINCVKKGYSVLGYDLQASAMQTLQEAGGKTADSLATLAAESEIIISMLQSGAQVTSVVEGNEGLFAHAAANSLYIDCSTIDVETARTIHETGQAHGLRTLDAPVSGGVAGAVAGTLTFMIGGDEAVLSQARPILECMGKTLVHAGEAGNGQAAKICNNMILGISMIAVSEAFVLAEKLGLPAKKLHEVVSSASGQCWVMDRYVPVPHVLADVPANRAYQAGFTAAMMLKDLRLSQQCAEVAKLSLPMASQAQQLYEIFNAEGHEQMDFSAIIQSIGK